MNTEPLDNKTAVVIDVLRATTTIVTALANGIIEVIPCSEIAEAKRVATEIGPTALLGGERDGQKIEGFDLGNSPIEYGPTVNNRRLVMTTTNGTRAMQSCRSARRILIAAFVNANAVVQAVDSRESAVCVCSGTDGMVTGEDVLLAGFLVDRIVARDPRRKIGNDQASIAMANWQQVESVFGVDSLDRALNQTQGGRNLIGRKLESDIKDCAAVDCYAIVPELQLNDWAIRIP